jgi:serine protease Do
MFNSKLAAAVTLGLCAVPVAAVSSILPAPAAVTSDAIANVAEKRVAAVVNISTSKTVSAPQRRQHPMSQDPLFRHFFGQRGGQRGMPEPRRENSLGSGVIVRKDGIVLTNNHVIADADSIRVTLSDGREFNAKVIGSDPKSDVAVLRMEKPPRDLRPIPLGDSKGLRLGEMVVAIGNPFGLGHTVTMGIVSAKGRANVGIVDYEDFIQTDAAINPGNSGGALIDLHGNLVGINTAIASRSGGYQGIGFAVPSNMARSVMSSLLKHGRVIRGWLGVAIQPVTRDLQKALSLKSARGVLVSDVVQDSPAARGGLRRGDVILRLQGEELRDPAHLRNRVAAAGAGGKVRVMLLRNGKKKQIRIRLGELDGEQPGRALEVAPEHAGSGNLAGLTVENLNAQNRKRFDISSRQKSGLVVSSVVQGSKAARAGLRRGDVLLELNQKPLRSISAFKQLYKRSGKQTLLLVQRARRTLYIVLNK